MSAELNGKQVAFLLTDGYEDSELTSPWEAVTGAGATARLVSPATQDVTGKNGHVQPVDVAVAEASSDDYHALVLPGGVVNADDLRVDENSVAFAKAFFEQGKPVGVICHGAWILIEADVVRGLPEPQDGSAERGCILGGRGGRRRPGTRVEPDARRPPGLQREARRGDR